MLFRATLVAVSLAAAAIGSASLAGAEPARSPSYQDGYNSEHTYYSDPRNRNFLKNTMQQAGYDTGAVCRLEISGGAQPPNPADWLSGCIDALHDLGIKP